MLLEGHIKVLGGPYVAHGPDVAQACSKSGMHNSDFLAGQKMLLKYLRARLVQFFSNFYSVSIKNQAKYTYIWALRARL